ncbi:hypothetical protein HDU93_004843 [Gonapodya sp. JEL0774]|nr:hypothetical protein HDU93_004843 [Gonapodya sp. JEL0774]
MSRSSPTSSAAKLIEAVERGDILEVENLLTNGADPNAVKTVTLLLLNKTDTVNGESALALAILHGHDQIVEVLLKHGADPMQKISWIISEYPEHGESWTIQKWDNRWRYKFSCTDALSLAWVGTCRRAEFHENGDESVAVEVSEKVLINMPGGDVVHILDSVWGHTPNERSVLYREHNLHLQPAVLIALRKCSSAYIRVVYTLNIPALSPHALRNYLEAMFKYLEDLQRELQVERAEHKECQQLLERAQVANLQKRKELTGTTVAPELGHPILSTEINQIRARDPGTEVARQHVLDCRLQKLEAQVDHVRSALSSPMTPEGDLRSHLVMVLIKLEELRCDLSSERKEHAECQRMLRRVEGDTADWSARHDRIPGDSAGAAPMVTSGEAVQRDQERVNVMDNETVDSHAAPNIPAIVSQLNVVQLESRMNPRPNGSSTSARNSQQTRPSAVASDSGGSKLEMEISRLQRGLEAKTNSCIDLKAELVQFKGKLQQLEIDNVQLRKDLKRARRGARSVVLKARTHAARHQEELDHIRSKLNEGIVSFERALMISETEGSSKEQGKRRMETIRSLETDAEVLQDRHGSDSADQHAKQNELDEKVRSLEEEKANLEIELRKMKSKADEASKRANAVETSRSEQEIELGTLRIELSAAETKIKSLEYRIGEMTTEARDSVTARAVLYQNLSTWESRARRAEEEQASSQITKKELDAQLTTMRGTNEEASKRAKEAEMVRDEREAELVDLREQVSVAKSTITRLESEVAVIKKNSATRIEELETRAQEAKSQTAVLQRKIAELQIERGRISASKNTMECQLTASNRQLETVRLDLEAANGQRDTAVRTKVDLETKLEASKQESERLNGVIRAHALQVECLRSTNASLETESRKKIEALTSQVAKLTSTNAELQSRLRGNLEERSAELSAATENLKNITSQQTSTFERMIDTIRREASDARRGEMDSKLDLITEKVEVLRTESRASLEDVRQLMIRGKRARSPEVSDGYGDYMSPSEGSSRGRTVGMHEPDLQRGSDRRGAKRPKLLSGPSPPIGEGNDDPDISQNSYSDISTLMKWHEQISQRERDLARREWKLAEDEKKLKDIEAFAITRIFSSSQRGNN